MLLQKLTIAPGNRPCLWERGGALANTGSSQIITDALGEAKQAIYLNDQGKIRNGKHALIPVEVGDKIVTVEFCYDAYFLLILEIIDICDGQAVCEDCTALFEDAFEEAITAAFDKAHDRDCCTPYVSVNSGGG